MTRVRYQGHHILMARVRYQGHHILMVRLGTRITTF